MLLVKGISIKIPFVLSVCYMRTPTSRPPRQFIFIIIILRENGMGEARRLAARLIRKIRERSDLIITNDEQRLILPPVPVPLPGCRCE